MLSVTVFIHFYHSSVFHFMILLQCIYSVVGTHLGCLQLETNMNNTAMYIFGNI